MLDFETLLPTLTNVDGTPVYAEADKSALLSFFDAHRRDSLAELERKRETQRTRVALHAAWNTWAIGNQIGVTRRPNPPPNVEITWADPHLDSAKLLILRALVEGREKGKSSPKNGIDRRWGSFRDFASTNKDAVTFIVLIVGALGGAFLFVQKLL